MKRWTQLGVLTLLVLVFGAPRTGWSQMGTQSFPFLATWGAGATSKTCGAATCLSDVITGMGRYGHYSCYLMVTAKTGAPTSLDVYVQQAIDGPTLGTETWNDYAHFTQVGNATGTWFLHFGLNDVNTTAGAVTAGAVKADGSLAAATEIGGYLGDRIRFKAVAVGGGTDYTYKIPCQAVER